MGSSTFRNKERARVMNDPHDNAITDKEMLAKVASTVDVSCATGPEALKVVKVPGRYEQDIHPFLAWLETKGCQVTINQEDDGSGYVVAEVVVPNTGAIYDVTVQV